jgi:hypothetical protein
VKQHTGSHRHEVFSSKVFRRTWARSTQRLIWTPKA